MDSFAAGTGLTGERPQRRYLWTDAFAVCNLLGLARRTGEGRFLELALRLIDGVHHVLGQHRGEDERRGWLSGVSASEGENHPTAGGLRIGKKLPERRPGQPLDESLEWERDGQYFHYLTRWMHALDLVARTTGQSQFNRWARELAEVAHKSFVYRDAAPGQHRMYWKMSIDLSHPLVPSMGHHDPLDGFLTCIELQTTASLMSSSTEGPNLGRQVGDFSSMIDEQGLATADPLGLGGLLMDAARVAQLLAADAFRGASLLDALLRAARQGLAHYAAQGDQELPASHRIAFRELGLAIGLSAAGLVAQAVQTGRLRFAASGDFLRSVTALAAWDELRSGIVSFWLDGDNRRSRSWKEHQDINDVMLASALIPEGVVLLPPVQT